jgi:hypothetical protein
MAFCAKCGTQLNEGAVFCSVCGTQVNPPINPSPVSVIPPNSSFNSDGKINVMETVFRPFKDARWIQKILLGGLIALIPFIGGIFLQGFTWIFCRRVISRNHDLPEWNEWGEMLRRGFGVFVIGLCYAIIPIIAALLLGLTGGGIVSLMKNPSAVCGVCLIPVLVLLIVIFLSFFFYPLSLTSYAGEGIMSAAFDFSRFWVIVSTHFVEYLSCYLAIFVSFVIVMAGTIIISFVLVLIPCLGWIALMLVSGAAGLTISLMATSTFGEFYRLRVK